MFMHNWVVPVLFWKYHLRMVHYMFSNLIHMWKMCWGFKWLSILLVKYCNGRGVRIQSITLIKASFIQFTSIADKSCYEISKVVNTLLCSTKKLEKDVTIYFLVDGISAIYTILYCNVPWYRIKDSRCWMQICIKMFWECWGHLSITQHFLQ